MPTYDADYYAQRVFSTFPKAWGAQTTFQPGGNLYEFVKAVCAPCVTLKNAINYAVLQTRISTATDSNLDTISSDYFGQSLPRLPSEPDASFRARILDALTSPRVTIAAIQNACQLYVDYFNALPQNSSRVIAAIYVFDGQTNPDLAATIGLADGSFVINFQYPTNVSYAWELGANYLGYDSYLISTGLTVLTSGVDPNLQAIVNLYKAEGTTPVYASSAYLT